MDTMVEATIFGRKLTKEQAETLLRKLHEDGVELHGRLDDAESIPVAKGVSLLPFGAVVEAPQFDIEELRFVAVYVGHLVRAKHSRWEPGDCGSHTSRKLPDEPAIREFLRSQGIEDGVDMHDLTYNPPDLIED